MEEATKRKSIRFKGDKGILIMVVLLLGPSILSVFSTEGNRVLSHLTNLAVCYVGLAVGYFLNYKKMLGNFAILALIMAGGLLVVTLGSSAVRGITIFGRDLQTFYLIGFLMILFWSNYIGRRLDSGQEQLSVRDQRYCAVLLLGFCAGIAALNMSTAIILFITGMVIFFVGNFRWKTLLGITGLAVTAVVVLALLVYFEKGEIGRFGTFVNRWEYYFTKENVNGYGDQMILSRAAIARGGLHPAGPGKGVIKYRLPENSTDYVYASISEEAGLYVGLPIIVIYLMIFYRSWRIARNSKSAVGSLVAYGIGFWLTCQALIHIGVNCELLPATGQTLPFISTGGASLFVSGVAVGMLLNVSKINALESMQQDPRTLFIHGDNRRG